MNIKKGTAPWGTEFEAPALEKHKEWVEQYIVEVTTHFELDRPVWSRLSCKAKIALANAYDRVRIGK